MQGCLKGCSGSRGKGVQVEVEFGDWEGVGALHAGIRGGLRGVGRSISRGTSWGGHEKNAGHHCVSAP